MKLTRSDWLFGLALCVLLQSVWAVRDWASLSALHLPDTDDMMRLQQIRDWLGGQSWFDLTQHRLGVGDGLPMHWTRVNDLIPALIMVVVTPFAGVHNAELAAVLIGPAVLFFAFLMLSARAALSLGGAATTKTAILIAALAFPAAGMFIPGRIDHHALQIVLLLGAVTAALGSVPKIRPQRGRWLVADETEGDRYQPLPAEQAPSVNPFGIATSPSGGGILAGAACALSIVVGLETVPQIVALVGAIVFFGRRISQNSELLVQFIRGMIPVVGISGFLFAPYHTEIQTCDSFNWAMGAAILILLFTSLLALGAIRFPIGRVYCIAFAGLIALSALVQILSHPACRSGPYGQIDPFLKRVWLNHVGEAQGVFAQPHPALILGYCTLVIAAGIAAAWFAWKRPEARARYLIIGAPIGMSLLVMLFQLRGAYIGAGLAAPVMAQLVAAARSRGTFALAGAWLLSAGVIHHIIADDLDGRMASEEHGEVASVSANTGAGCTAPATMAALNQLPPARFMAPMDAGAYIIGATHHSVFAGPYHRNNAGNLAMYRFFLAAPDAALPQARVLHVDYVFMCPGAFAEVQHEPNIAKSLVVALKSGHAPAWLEPVALKGSAATLYRVKASD